MATSSQVDDDARTDEAVDVRDERTHAGVPRAELRPEIQGLRAVAVLLVIVYHLFPGQVSGGYVGVDVFFVLSGFLITSHLVREAASPAGLSLTGFWARRIRRLLPASLLVLAVCCALTWAFLPGSLWDDTLRQVVTSALYVQNWELAAQSVDYSAMGNQPSLVQHYWSLSAEEQFYLVWPLLVLVGVVLARRAGWSLRGVMLVVLGAVTVASFAYSVWQTADDAAYAYFVTPTRAWEFGVGALLALAAADAPGARRRSGAARGVGTVRLAAGWAGLVAVVWAGLVLTDATPFPGAVAAVPVLGAAAVIWAGSDRSAASVARPLSVRPMTFVGDISYALYLWHWPLVVVTPYITGTDLRLRDAAVVLALTFVLSWACTRWVEDPVRRSRALSAVPWRAYPVAVVGMAVVVVAALGLQARLDHTNREAAAAARAALADADPCTGPAILDNVDTCGAAQGDGTPALTPALVREQNTSSEWLRCMSDLDETELVSCDLGESDDPERTVAVVGDSHATALLGAFDAMGTERSWSVQTFTRASCPFSDAQRTLPDEPPVRWQICHDSNLDIERRILDDPTVDTVFVTAFSSAYGWADPEGETFADPATDGFRSLWARLTDGGKQVVVVRDVPTVANRFDVPVCLEQNAADPTACGAEREAALAGEFEADAVEGAPEGVRLIELTDQFCDDQRCHVVLGDVIAYRDWSHVSDEFSALLGPYLGVAFDEVDEPVED